MPSVRPNDDFALVAQVYDEATDRYVDVDTCQWIIFTEKCGEPALLGEVFCETHFPWS